MLDIANSQTKTAPKRNSAETKSSLDGHVSNILRLREAWLHGIREKVEADFRLLGYPLPAKIRISMGSPPRNNSNVIGECWSDKVSADQHFEIFISPTFDDPIRICDILIHELTHAAVGFESGHRGPFGMVARAFHLEGRLPATFGGEAFKAFITPIIDAIGPFPHAAVIVPGRKQTKPIGKTSETFSTGPRKQKTRLKKVQCSKCGYIARVSKKWLDESGAPLCPTHRLKMKVS